MIGGCLLAIAGYVMLVSLCNVSSYESYLRILAACGQDGSSALWRLLFGCFRGISRKSGQSRKSFLRHLSLTSATDGDGLAVQ